MKYKELYDGMKVGMTHKGKKIIGYYDISYYSIPEYKNQIKDGYIPIRVHGYNQPLLFNIRNTLGLCA